MNAGNVSTFGCGRSHPQHGDQAPCRRKRHHGGDHRGEVNGRVVTWPDSPLAVADETWPPLTDTWDEATGLRAWGDSLDAVTRCIVLAVLVIVVAAGPPLLALLYGAAF